LPFHWTWDLCLFYWRFCCSIFSCISSYNCLPFGCALELCRSYCSLCYSICCCICSIPACPSTEPEISVGFIGVYVAQSLVVYVV
jgi:hypothetical protein